MTDKKSFDEIEIHDFPESALNSVTEDDIQSYLKLDEKEVIMSFAGKCGVAVSKGIADSLGDVFFLCPCRRTVKESLIHAKIFPLTVEWVRTCLLLGRRGTAQR